MFSFGFNCITVKASQHQPLLLHSFFFILIEFLLESRPNSRKLKQLNFKKRKLSYPKV